MGDTGAVGGSSGTGDGWSEGQDWGAADFTERVWPAWWMWPLTVFFTGSLAVAYGAALGAGAGWAVLIGTTTLSYVGLFRGAPVLRVDQRVFRAGRARLPLEFVGRVASLTAEQSRAARGPKADASAHFVLRTAATGLTVIVEVTDPEDPHGSWLVSTRHPDQLARAIAAGRDRCRSLVGDGDAAPG